MPKPSNVMWCATILVACACGAADPTDSIDMGDPPPTNVLRVSGSYGTNVALVADSCGGSVVQSSPTSVTHALGATTLSLAHAGSQYAGTIATDGRFQTTPSSLDLNGYSYVVALTGEFSMSGFEADVTIDRFQQGTQLQRCRYVAKWVATRVSGTNVIPAP